MLISNGIASVTLVVDQAIVHVTVIESGKDRADCIENSTKRLKGAIFQCQRSIQLSNQDFQKKILQENNDSTLVELDGVEFEKELFTDDDGYMLASCRGTVKISSLSTGILSLISLFNSFCETDEDHLILKDIVMKPNKSMLNQAIQKAIEEAVTAAKFELACIASAMHYSKYSIEGVDVSSFEIEGYSQQLILPDISNEQREEMLKDLAKVLHVTVTITRTATIKASV